MSQPERQPMQADIAQIIKAGWSSGKSSDDVATEILREFDVPAALAATPAVVWVEEFDDDHFDQIDSAATPAGADDISRYIANAHAQDAEISASETEFMVELKKRACTPAVGGKALTIIHDAIDRSVDRLKRMAADDVPPIMFQREADLIALRVTKARVCLAALAATPAVGVEARDKIAAIICGQHCADFEDDACGCKTCELERDHCRKLADQILALAIPPASPLRGREIDQADYKIGWWLSGALEDPNVCAEMKADINKWFEAHQPVLVTSASSTSPQEQPAAAPATEREWQPMSLAPKVAEIIGMDSDGRIFNMRWEPDDSGENWYDVHGDQLAYPVRWMPMPFPAASDKKTPAPKLNADRENKTYYLERSKVREILIDHNAATQVGMGFFRWSGLSKIDALPIFTVEDFRAQSPILSDQCLQVPRK